VALVLVSSTPFSPPSAVAINASGVVPVTSSRFVFIDNNDDEALLELNVNPDGTQRGPVVRRPIAGLDRGAMSDPEGIARIDRNGAIDLIVASSLSVWGSPRRARPMPTTAWCGFATHPTDSCTGRRCHDFVNG